MVQTFCIGYMKPVFLSTNIKSDGSLKRCRCARLDNSGFTLIELLVVIIIIGILAAIALPSFLSQANKAKESESKQYIGSMNRTQQAYFLEKDQFASDVTLLGLGIKTQTSNFTYAINPQGDNKSSILNASYPKNTNTLRAHLGGVQVANTTGDDKTGEATTLAILCQRKKPGTADTGGVVFATSTANTGPTCNEPYETLK